MLSDMYRLTDERNALSSEWRRAWTA